MRYVFAIYEEDVAERKYPLEMRRSQLMTSHTDAARAKDG